MTNEEAIKHLQTYSTTNGSGQTTQAEHEEAKRTAIKALSEQRTGHWQALTGLFFCSVCDGGFAKPWRYCPNCGAKIESEEQS